MSSNAIILLLLLLVGIIVNGIAFGPDILRHLRNQRIVNDGIAATAVIKSVEDTGNRINNNPQIRLTLEVMPDNEAPYETELTAVISVVAISSFQTGAVVHVKYDPKNPKHVALVNE